MKRIIDIDKPTFDDIIATNSIDGHFGRVDWCIRNSKPYEERPQGGLISREALKKAIEEVQYTQEFCIERAIDHSINMQMLRMVIDDAPTVDAIVNTIEVRPQGEWIIDGHHIRCNRCNEYTCDTDREGNKIPDNFCPNCGADMRGKEADND